MRGQPTNNGSQRDESRSVVIAVIPQEGTRPKISFGQVVVLAEYRRRALAIQRGEGGVRRCADDDDICLRSRERSIAPILGWSWWRVLQASGHLYRPLSFLCFRRGHAPRSCWYLLDARYGHRNAAPRVGATSPQSRCPDSRGEKPCCETPNHYPQKFVWAAPCLATISRDPFLPVGQTYRRRQ